MNTNHEKVPPSIRLDESIELPFQKTILGSLPQKGCHIHGKPFVRGAKPSGWEKHEALASSESTGPHVKKSRISVPHAPTSRLMKDDKPEIDSED